MIEYGSVVSVNDDAAVVEMGMHGACKKCGLCQTSSGGKTVLLLARNAAGAAVGDAVEVEISPGRVLAAAFVVYLIPVVMTVIGFAVGSALSDGSEESALPIVLAVVFLVASFLGVWLYDARVRKSDRRDAAVRRVLGEDEAERVRHIEVVKFGG
jgi:positive regulator of sigma E activity